MKNPTLVANAMASESSSRYVQYRPPKRVIGLVAVLATLFVPASAGAEGSWFSSLSGVRSGFNSRTFWDNQNDSHDTRVYLGRCSRSDGANHLVKAQLKRKKWGPDAKYTRYDFSRCNTSYRVANYGNISTRGNFYITYSHYSFGRMSAGDADARY